MDIPLDDIVRFLTPFLPLAAYVKTRLAQAYRALGRWEEARRMALEALDLIDRIGLHVLREDVEKVLQELPETLPAAPGAPLQPPATAGRA